MQQKAEKDRQRIIMLNADPFDTEAQRMIAEEIRFVLNLSCYAVVFTQNYPCGVDVSLNLEQSSMVLFLGRMSINFST